MKLEKNFGIRLDITTYDLIEEISKRQGIEKADFVRRAIRKELARLSYLSQEDRKALGV